MLGSLVPNKVLCYGQSVLSTLFDRRPVEIAWQWTITTHIEVAAAVKLVE